jgi:phage gpG-like protein
MEFEFVVDVSKFRQLLEKWGPAQYVKLRSNAVKAAFKFITYISKRWYNGRHGNVGLNTPTGGLVKAWAQRVEFNTRDGLVAFVSNNKEYGRIHEKGGIIKFRNGGTATIPKRTFVYEDFKSTGLAMFINQLRTSFV